MAVQLDEDTWWLIVSVLPLGAFGQQAVFTAKEVDETLDGIRALDLKLFMQGRLAGFIVFLFVVLLSFGLGCGLTHYVSHPLERLSTLMLMLMDLDFAHGTEEFAELSVGQTCRIRDVGKLQRAFCRLSKGIEAFLRFVPEPVVRNIVRGDQRATRLHVSKRQVTIMFTAIRDFTAIAEDLSQGDVLFILTRYFTVMTRLVELYEGVISEILTDGLLVFWNTPHVVEDHSGKACAAALAMESAMGLMNAEFARAKLPQLSIRTGLHTGETLSGNLGSDVKMKFGCLGDPVNLTSRLEGLCNYYGVGAVCSSATHDALAEGHGFLCRRLDLVQVKGKRDPITVYEVMQRRFVPAGVDEVRAAAEQARVDAQVDRVRRYEEALAAFQEARFETTISLTEALLNEDPRDLASAKLRSRALKHGGFEDGVAGLTEKELASWTGVLSMLVK